MEKKNRTSTLGPKNLSGFKIGLRGLQEPFPEKGSQEEAFVKEIFSQHDKKDILWAQREIHSLKAQEMGGIVEELGKSFFDVPRGPDREVLENLTTVHRGSPDAIGFSGPRISPNWLMSILEPGPATLKGFLVAVNDLVSEHKGGGFSRTGMMSTSVDRKVAEKRAYSGEVKTQEVPTERIWDKGEIIKFVKSFPTEEEGLEALKDNWRTHMASGPPQGTGSWFGCAGV